MRNPGSRNLCWLVMLMACAGPGGGQNTSQATMAAGPPGTQDPAQIVQFLSHTISWYRQLAIEQQLATEPSDVTYYQENHRVADQVVQIAFDWARSQAQLQAKRPAQKPSSTPQPATSSATVSPPPTKKIGESRSESPSTVVRLAAAWIIISALFRRGTHVSKPSF